MDGHGVLRQKTKMHLARAEIDEAGQEQGGENVEEPVLAAEAASC